MGNIFVVCVWQILLSLCLDTVPDLNCTMLKMLLLETRVGLSEVRFQFPHGVDDGISPQ